MYSLEEYLGLIIKLVFGYFDAINFLYYTSKHFTYSSLYSKTYPKPYTLTIS